MAHIQHDLLYFLSAALHLIMTHVVLLFRLESKRAFNSTIQSYKVTMPMSQLVVRAQVAAKGH